MKEREYVQSLQNLDDAGIVEHIHKKAEKSLCNSVARKTEASLEPVDLDGRQAKCHLIDPEYTNVPHPGFLCNTIKPKKIYYLCGS